MFFAGSQQRSTSTQLSHTVRELHTIYLVRQIMIQRIPFLSFYSAAHQHSTCAKYSSDFHNKIMVFALVRRHTITHKGTTLSCLSICVVPVSTNTLPLAHHLLPITYYPLPITHHPQGYNVLGTTYNALLSFNLRCTRQY